MTRAVLSIWCYGACGTELAYGAMQPAVLAQSSHTVCLCRGRRRRREQARVSDQVCVCVCVGQRRVCLCGAVLECDAGIGCAAMCRSSRWCAARAVLSQRMVLRHV
eukprot:2028317-Rhodomonas_salina.1